MSITSAQLAAITSAMDMYTYALLINARGGCTCHVSPACPACCNPLTEAEAQTLGLVPPVVGPSVPLEVWRAKQQVDTTDYMAVVRVMCGDRA